MSTYLTRAKGKLGVASRTSWCARWFRTRARRRRARRWRWSPTSASYDEWFRVLRKRATTGAATSPLLTRAEAEVLAGLLRGLRDAEIARDCGTSVRTVAAQIAAIVRKGNVGSRAELVAVVISGLIDR